MNSKYSMFDLLVIDPGLSRSADLKNIFFTGMDGYFHALEIIRGSNRFPLTDSIAKSAYEISRESLNQLFEVGLSEDVFEKLAVCSFLGGIALANGTVGLIHPISAALSVVLDISHGEANCLASLALGEYYPEDSSFFENIMNGFVDATNYKPPLKIRDIRKNLNELIESTIVHEKPLSNHLGEDWRVVLNNTELERIFLKVSNLNLSSRR
jgi:3-deoxy-alpha-D-manno-octulosonate 8-oxidase